MLSCNGLDLLPQTRVDFAPITPEHPIRICNCTAALHARAAAVCGRLHLASVCLPHIHQRTCMQSSVYFLCPAASANLPFNHAASFFIDDQGRRCAMRQRRNRVEARAEIYSNARNTSAVLVAPAV